MNDARCFPATSNARTWGPPPAPGPVTIHPWSPTEAAAISTPAVMSGPYAKNCETRFPVAVSKTLTQGAVPGPGAVTRSATPSPVTSARAVRTPPVAAAS